MINKIKEKADFFNSLFNVVRNLMLICSAVYGFLAKIVNIDMVKDIIIKYLYIKEDKIYNFFEYENIAKIICVILIVTILLKLLYNAIRTSALAQKKTLILLKMLHFKFVHDIRSKIVEVNYLLPKRISKAQKDDEDMKIVYNKELEKLKNNIAPYVNALGDYLTSYRNKKISVCIKTFLNGSVNKQDYMDEEIITIARSKNTKNSRNKKTYHAIVKKNSDFIDLCYGRSSFFGKTHLKQLYNSGLYKNDSPNWWKHYNCTLVAPIRYYNKDNENTNINIDIDVIGFLCIDCKEDILEWEKADSFELQC